MWSVPTSNYLPPGPPRPPFPTTSAAPAFYPGIPVAGSPPAAPGAPAPASGPYGSSGSFGPGGLPPIPVSFPELEALRPEELRALAADEGAFMAFVENLSYTRNVRETVSNLQGEVAALKRLNEGKLSEQSLATVQDDIAKMQADEAALIAQVEANRRARDQVYAKNSTQTLLQRMLAAALESEEKSKQLHDSMIANTMPYNEFAKEYIKVRTQYHDRQAKAARLQDIVRLGG